MNSNKKSVRAVLLAAGQGKRMKSTKAKVLHEVLGKTILGRIIAAAEAAQVEHIHVVVGHASDQVKQFLEKNPPKVPCTIHLQEPQLGTGDALRKVVPSLANFKGTLLVSVADAPLLQGETLAALVAGHQKEEAVVTLLTTIVDDAKNYGRILRDDKGCVTGIIEDKDASPEQRSIKEVNPAIYCFEWPAIAEGLDGLKNDNRQKEYYLTDLIGWASKSKHKTFAVLAEDWREVAGINSRLELSEAHRLLRDITVQRLSLESGVTIVDPETTWVSPEVKVASDTVILPGCYLVGDITIGSGCSIGPNTVMQGQVVVGDDSVVIQSLVADSQIGKACRVGPFAHLRDGNILSDKVRVGNFVEIKKTKIGASSNVSHLSYVGDAEVGQRSNVGAGTITANYDHITKAKNRTVIGDDVSTGSNSVLVAPVTVHDGAVIGAGTVATKDVPAGSLAVGRSQQRVIEGWADKKRKGD
jgi:bifunctional UDP-N-acetylglucosamine pyrophosphorylase/glucosamine-1-phosphate N-acetyltransferase